MKNLQMTQNRAFNFLTPSLLFLLVGLLSLEANARGPKVEVGGKVEKTDPSKPGGPGGKPSTDVRGTTRDGERGAEDASRIMSEAGAATDGPSSRPGVPAHANGEGISVSRSGPESRPDELQDAAIKEAFGDVLRPDDIDANLIRTVFGSEFDLNMNSTLAGPLLLNFKALMGEFPKDSPIYQRILDGIKRGGSAENDRLASLLMAIVAKNPNWKTDTVKVEIDGKEVEVPRAVAIIRDQWDSLGADGKADGKIDDTEIQNVLSALEINQGALKTALDHFASYKAAKGSERTKVISTAVAKLEGFEKNVTSDLGKESIREIVSMLRSGDDNQIQAAMHYMAKMDYIRTHAEGRVSDTELAEFFTKCKNRV